MRGFLCAPDHVPAARSGRCFLCAPEHVPAASPKSPGDCLLSGQPERDLQKLIERDHDDEDVFMDDEAIDEHPLDQGTL